MPQNPFDALLTERDEQDEPIAPVTPSRAENPFDRMLAQPESDQEQRMRLARRQAIATTPEKRAEAIKLSNETGVPLSVVERNFESISQRRALEGTPYTKVQKEAPAVAEWSTDQNNAAISHDDLENLGALEWILKAPSHAFAQQINRGRYAELRVKSLFTPLTREEQDQLNSYKLHSEMGGELGVGDSFFAKAMTGAGRLLAQSIEPAKYAVVGGLETAAVGAAGGAALGPGALAGAAGGFTIGARAGVMYGVFKSAATQEAAGAYDEMLAMTDETGKKIDPDVARVAALTVGGLNGLVEQVGLEAFLKRFPGLDKISKGMGRDAMKAALRNPTVRAGFARLAKNYAGGLSTEVATEVAQRAISIAGEELSKFASETGLAQRSPMQVWDDLVLEAANAVPEFALGMMPGPVLTMARDAGRAKQAEQSVQFFTALGEGVVQSKTAQRMPESFQQLVSDATKDGPVEHVYAPVDTWTTYWQQQGQDPDKMATAITGRPNALTEAGLSGQLRIPTAVYAAKLAGTEHNAFLTNELRLGSPDAMNGREMEEFRERIDQARQRVQEELKAETPEAKALQAFQADITSQLVESGVPRGTAATMATALAGVGEMAQRAGFNPADVFQAYGLQVQRRTAAEAPTVAGGTTIEQQADPEAIPGLAALEASLGGATVETLDPSTGNVLNASGESAASVEALNRQEGMRAKGEQFVVYDRAGRRRVLLGPDAVDYRPHKGETYGVESPTGFRLLDDQGGRPPALPANESQLGRNLGRILGQPGRAPGVAPGVKVEGTPGDANERGERAVFVGYQPGFGSMPTMALYTIQGGERDGSTIDADGLKEAGIPLPPTPPLLEFTQRAIAATPQLRAWFGNSAVVDEEGQPLVVYHGTTQLFTTFDRERANPESDFGAGFYFSNNPDDVGENYAGVGPDLQAKIERRAEQLAQEADREYNDPEIVQQARAEFIAQEGMTIPVFLKIENPVVVGGPNETRFTFTMEEDEQGEFTGGESGTLVDFILALRSVSEGFFDADVDGVIASLTEAALDGDITASRLFEIIKADEKFNYVTDDVGNLVGFEVVRQALEQAGFDGIIDNTVDVKFGSQRRIGKAMAGMNEDTVHYIAFHPTQIKSALFNRGTFDPVNPDILFQSAADPAPAQQAFYSRLNRAVEESKLAKATGNQWKATIRNSRVGVNKDEFAIARIEDLDDKTVYTRDELIAYLKQNRPRVNVVMLEGASEIDEDALRERADEIHDRMVEEAEQEFDWDDVLGTATYIEEEVEDEVEREREVDTGEVDEDGDPIMETETYYETETETRYYPAIDGGMKPRTDRRYGLIDRRGEEMIPDAEPYDNARDATRAAQEYLDDIDREPYYEHVSDLVRESVDWSDAEREAREELENDPQHQTGGRYAEYVLEPAAEEDSYKEVFITAGDVEKPPFKPQTREELQAEIAQNAYRKAYADLDADQRNKVDLMVNDAEVEQIQEKNRAERHGPRVYAWKDGHDLYNDIENPIVRIRLNVRQTVQERKPGEPPPMPQRVLFLEEVQPPNPTDQKKMVPIFLKHWREIAFKWALRHAAEMGLHAVAWTTGAQQADRYSLRKTAHKVMSDDITVDSPAWQAGLRKLVKVDLKNAPMLVMQVAEDGVVAGVLNDFGNRWDQLIGQPLAGVIGEELATSLMQPGEQQVEGKGLLVGGEGLKKLYDYDFRNVVNSLPAVKKNGGRVGTVPIRVKAEYEIETVDAQTAASLDEHAQRVYQRPFDELDAAAQEEVRQTLPDLHRVVLDGKVMHEATTRDAAWDYIQKNKLVTSEQPALIMTPELVNAVNGGQALFQSARYRPVSASEIETLQEQVNAVVDKAIADAPSGSGLAALVTPTGELHIDSIMVPTEEQGKGAGSKMMRALIEWADQHNIQMSLIPSPNEGQAAALNRFYRRLGFVRNGSARFYDPTSYGDLVRPAKDDTPARRLAMQRGEGKPPRGMVQFAPNRQTTITLFETADLSTFLHETGHFYLEVMGDLVDRLDVLDPATLSPQQQQLRADYALILGHLGVTSRGEIDVPHHEQFARSFETYLMEGRAPSPQLREAFARFRAWLLGIYRSLKALNAPLSDDIRKVFDRMLASDEAIAEAESAGHLTPMFATPESAGMSPERFALYRQSIEQASAAARERLDAKLMAEVQREQTAQWRERKAETRTQVEQETYAMPVYRAIAAMTKGTNPDGTPFVEGEAPVPMRMSKKMIVDQFGPERLAGLPKRTYSAEGGADPNFIADLFGFSSGDELLTNVSQALPMRQHIARETDRRMLLEHGSLLLDGTLHVEAQAAVADETRDIIVREELRALARLRDKRRPDEAIDEREQRDERAYERRWFEAEARLRIAIAEGRQQVEIDRLRTEVNKLKAVTRSGPSRIRGAIPPANVLRDQARDLIANTVVRDLHPGAYWAAARRASQSATALAAAQDFDGAILAKHQELISLALYRETVRAKEDVHARVNEARAIGRPQSMAKLMKAGETYHDQVAGVLDRFEFAPVPQVALDRRASLWKWVQGQESQGIPVELPDELLDEAKRTNFQQLTVAELVGVTDGLKQLVHLARFKGRLLKAAGRRQLNAVAQKIATSVREHKGAKAKGRRDRTQGTERLRLVQGVLAAHRKMASLVREMDGFVDGGPMWEAIVRPLNEAGAREAEMNADATRRFGEIIETAYPRSQKSQLYVRAFVPAVDRSLSKMERLMIALNWGNEGNRDRIMRAEGWSADQVQAVLDTLDERDARFVRDTFTFIGSYWAEIAAKQERVTGVRPERVEASSFRIGGTTLAGGYFPLKYDDRLSAKAAGQLDLEGANLAKAAAFAHATTKRGHTQKRQETLDQPVQLHFGVMFEHVANVIHDLTHHEALIDVGRILGHNDVQKAIYETHGDIVYKTVKNTIRDIAYGDQPAANAFEKALNHSRTGATVVGLAWSLTTPAMQFLGLANSAVRLRPKWMARGMSRWLGSPARMAATVKWVQEQSVVMRTRPRTQQRELNEIRNKVGVYSGKFSGIADEMLAKTTFDTVTRQGIVDSYFYFIAKMQQVVDTITWLGAYEKAMSEGGAARDDEARAIAIADQTVLDTQGGGQTKDLAGVQRGGPPARLFTNFYSAFSATYNQAVEVGKVTRLSSPVDIGRMAVDYMVLLIVPASAGYFIRQAMKPGDDDTPLAEALIVENISYMMGMMVGLREFAGAVQGYYGYEGPAGARIFSAGSRAIQQVRQGELDEAALRATNEFFGLLFHYPAAQVWRTANGFAAISEGKTENPLVLLTGPETKRQ